MTDPDTLARDRLQVALATIARRHCEGVWTRYRVRLSEQDVLGILELALSERERVEALRVAEIRALQLARTRPQRAVPRQTWSADAKTPVVNQWPDEPTRPGGKRR